MSHLLDLPNEILLLIFDKFNDRKYKSLIISLTSKELVQFISKRWEKYIIISEEIASDGNLHLLQWIKENGCSFDRFVSGYAAESGNLETLQWLKDINCPMDSLTYIYASCGGYLHVLEWLDQNTTISEKTPSKCFSGAAEKGHLEVIKWLKGKGYTWNRRLVPEQPEEAILIFFVFSN